MEGLEAELSRVYKTSSNLQHLLHEAKEQNKDVAASLIKKDEELSLLRKNKADIAHQLSLLKNENDTLQQQNIILKEQLTLFQQQDSLLSKISQDSEVAKQQNTILHSELQQTTRQTQQVEVEYHNLRAEFNQLLDAATNYSKELEDKVVELERTHVEKENLYATCIELQQLLETTTQALEETNGELQALQKQQLMSSRSARVDREEWVKAMNQVADDNKLLQKRVEETQVEKDQLATLLRDLEVEVELLQKQTLNDKGKMEEREKEKLTDKEKELTALRVEFENVQRLLEDTRKRHQTAEEEVQRLKRNFVREQESTSSTALALQQYQQQLQQLQQQQQVWFSDKNAYLDRLSSMTQKLEFMTRENEEMRHKLQRMPEIKQPTKSSDILAISEKTDVILKNAETLKTGRRTPESDNTEQGARLKAQLLESRRQEENYKTKLSEATQKIQQLYETINEYKLAYDALAHKISFLADERDMLRRQTEDLFKNLSKMERDEGVLKGALEKTKTICDEQSTELSELRSTVKEAEEESTKLRSKIAKLKKDKQWNR